MHDAIGPRGGGGSVGGGEGGGGWGGFVAGGSFASPMLILQTWRDMPDVTCAMR